MTTKLYSSLASLTVLTLAGCGGQVDPEPTQGRMASMSSVQAQERAGQLSAIHGPTLLNAPVWRAQPAEVPGMGSMQRQSALVVDGTPLVVDTTDRETVRKFYRDVFLAPRVPMGWTGNYATGNAGTVSQDYQRATLQRINWYRAMAGVPAAISLSAATSSKAQQAAFLMSVNNELSHYPSPSWKFYTAEAAEGALSSTLGLGYNGPDAIDAYMKDFGDINGPVGHRRWMLFPGTRTFGIGDVPVETVNGQRLWGGNAVWVMDADYYGPRPKVRDGFIAWPTRGFVPYQTVFARWSFSFTAADFSQAQVKVMHNGVPQNLEMEKVVDGAGENTIVWKMPGIGANGIHPQPTDDMKYQVTVSNVIVDKQARSFTYEVVVFDAGPVLNGPYSAYTVTMRDSVLTLIDNRGIEGTQTVKNPSRVDFADLSLAFDKEGNAGKAYRLYRAAFNRRPDLGGLGFWISAMDRGLDVKAIAREFTKSAEFASLYGASPTPAQIVRAMYLNVLHREPDGPGAAFWLQALEKGFPTEEILIEFSESAENKAQVAAEIAAGIQYKRSGE